MEAQFTGLYLSLTTKFMGMTPLEHEYKVMGLAPYAATKEQKYFMKTYNKVFKDIIWIDKKDPLKFKSRFPTGRFEYWLRKRAVGERFDNLAGALQHLTEDLVSQWVLNVVKYTGNGNIYCGGGVFMNVKMNMILSELPALQALKYFLAVEMTAIQ
jgi:carbamoyltransferase